jgi:Phage portal protein, SPP1 Gp6-like
MSDNSGLVASALEKTNPALAMSMDAANAFKSNLIRQGARVKLYRNYERGDHRAVITNQMRKMLRLTEDESGMVDFNGNYCGLVVDKMASRLHVNEITSGNPTTDNEWLGPLLEENDWDNLQTTTFRGAIRDADSYIMVDPQTLAWTAESAYDGYDGVVAIFLQGARTPVWACKLWSEAEESAQTETMRLVVYQVGEVTYWRGQENGAEVREDNRITKTEKGYEPTAENAMKFPVSKIPIVHFANRYENYEEEGESEIRAAIPLQDVYNRTLHTLTYASENSGYTKPWIIGMEADADGMIPGAFLNMILKDAKGNVINEPSPEMLEFLKSVRIGQLSATDLNQFLSVLDKLERVISQVTQTPIYGVTTEGNLSGEALKQLEIGLIGKVKRFQKQNNDSIRELVELTAEIQNKFNIEGRGNAPTLDTVSLTWETPEILDVTGQIAALVSMRLQAPGLWPDDWYRGKIGGLLGMSQNDIQKETDVINGIQTEQDTQTDLFAGDNVMPVGTQDVSQGA